MVLFTDGLGLLVQQFESGEELFLQGLNMIFLIPEFFKDLLLLVSYSILMFFKPLLIVQLDLVELFEQIGQVDLVLRFALAQLLVFLPKLLEFLLVLFLRLL